MGKVKNKSIPFTLTRETVEGLVKNFERRNGTFIQSVATPEIFLEKCMCKNTGCVWYVDQYNGWEILPGASKNDTSTKICKNGSAHKMPTRRRLATSLINRLNQPRYPRDD